MKLIKPDELKQKLENDEVLLIDVREPFEHKVESIESACLIPLSEISFEKLPSIKRPIIIHCKSGKRSADACNILLKQNPNLDIASLEGGIIAWKSAGFNVKKSNSNIIPIDRQTQIAAGSFCFIGTMLAYFVNHSFYIIPGFIGAGLIFAGVSGWCGMAKILARMPWNK